MSRLRKYNNRLLELAVCPRSQAPTSTVWGAGGNLFKRFYDMFSESPLCFLGKHGSCSTANGLWNYQKTFYKTFLTIFHPTHTAPRALSIFLPRTMLSYKTKFLLASNAVRIQPLDILLLGSPLHLIFI